MKNLIAITLVTLLAACNSTPTGANLTTDPILEKPAPEAPEEPVVEPTPEPTPEPSVTPSPEPSATMTPQEAFTATGLGTSAAYIPTAPFNSGIGMGNIQGIEIVDNDPQWFGVYLIYPEGAQFRCLRKSAFGSHTWASTSTLQVNTGITNQDVGLTNFTWVDGNTASVEVCTIAFGGVPNNCVLVTQDVE